jgi:hypothetical protein
LDYTAKASIIDTEKLGTNRIIQLPQDSSSHPPRPCLKHPTPATNKIEPWDNMMTGKKIFNQPESFGDVAVLKEANSQGTRPVYTSLSSTMQFDYTGKLAPSHLPYKELPKDRVFTKTVVDQDA